jgi:geranylgeranyl diphosphate synthase, type I
MRELGAEAVPLPRECRTLADRVDAELGAFLRGRRDEGVARAPGVEDLFDEIERVVGSGGKRLRPVFCLLGHRAAGRATGPEIVRAAAALELLHTFAIVHDDVMDGSRIRRGQPSTWAHFQARHRELALRGDPEASGLAGAILAGDLALILADQALVASGFPPDRLLAAVARYDRMRTEVVAGQYLDVAAAQRGATGEGGARRIAALKSGQYTVEGPLHIGAILGAGEAALLEALSDYGLPLGEAFQLRDDVLGVFGDPSVTGKDRDSDLLEGKRTVLVAMAAAKAEPEDRVFLEERLGRADLSPEELERMRSIIESSGALAATQELIGDLAARARAALASEAFPGDVRDLLDELVGTVTLRSL